MAIFSLSKLEQPRDKTLLSIGLDELNTLNALNALNAFNAGNAFNVRVSFSALLHDHLEMQERDTVVMVLLLIHEEQINLIDSNQPNLRGFWLFVPPNFNLVASDMTQTLLRNLDPSAPIRTLTKASLPWPKPLNTNSSLLIPVVKPSPNRPRSWIRRMK
jgi:hypothetical protein